MKHVPYPITIKVMYEEDATETPFIAYIPEFDVSSCGETEEKAIKNAKHALSLTLEEIKKDGNLDSFLGEMGVMKEKKSFFSFPK